MVDGYRVLGWTNSPYPQQIINVLEEHKPAIMALDANMSSETLRSLIDYASKHNVLSA